MLMRHARSSLAVSIVMVVAVVGGGGRLLSKNIGPSVWRKIYIIPRRNSGVGCPLQSPHYGKSCILCCRWKIFFKCCYSMGMCVLMETLENNLKKLYLGRGKFKRGPVIHGGMFVLNTTRFFLIMLNHFCHRARRPYSSSISLCHKWTWNDKE